MKANNRHPIHHSGRELFQGRAAIDYTESEQAFSTLVQTRLEDLLGGELNFLPLLRRYHREPDRLGVPLTPQVINPRELRLPVVERILMTLLQFLHNGVGVGGGPIVQAQLSGQLIERQAFTTRFPHILIERIDRYHEESREPLETEWVVKRIQNQRAALNVNRALNAANLGIEIVKIGYNLFR